MIELCQNCRFYFRDENTPEGQGLCRRFPPSIAVITQTPKEQRTNFHFPMMMDTGWCGEYSPSETTR